MVKEVFSGNRGEWSEPYVVLKLLADGKLHQADASMLPSSINSAKIIGVIREDTEAEIDNEGKATFIFLDRNGISQQYSLPHSTLEYRAKRLYHSITTFAKKNRAFQLPEEAIELQKLGFTQLKNPIPLGQKSVKRDITLKILDPNTGITPKLGFSVKSELGGAPTLLNASGATNVIYKLTGFDDTKMHTINTINTSKKTTDKVHAIVELANNIEFVKYQNDIFAENLMLIDCGLPRIVSDALYLHYFDGCSSTKEMLDKIKFLPNYKNLRSDFCTIKYKRFLRACALGMMPSDRWNDVDDASGGYIIVLPSGELIAFYIYNRALFDQYLVDHTKFERASTERHKYMSVYKEGTEYFIKLNLQIRFTK
ncbi:MAG: HpaII family restriction endonuclease [Victivallales bacterium]|nr:HpaII family restriction endonuclease [Victivallales bacterium]